MDWLAVGTLLTGIGVIVAGIATWRQSRDSRFALGVDLLMRMDERFDSAAMRKSRAMAARYFTMTSSSQPNDERGVDDVLNFFEMVAFLRARRVLDATAVWHTFGYWILGYYALAKSYIDHEQRADATVYSTFCRLWDEIRRVEERERHFASGSAQFSESDKAELLRFEANLIDLLSLPSAVADHPVAAPPNVELKPTAAPSSLVE